MTINNIIVEIDRTYENEVDGITVNSTIDSVSHITRVGVVVDAPDFVSVKKGDKVICHHNVFREKRDMKGRKMMSDYYLWDNKYFVPFDLVFAYIRGGEFKSLSPYCFVKPITKKDETVGGVIIKSNEYNSFKHRLSNEGVMTYPNEDMSLKGIKKGDRVVFKPFTRYEFNIGGELLYKMSTKDIVAKV